MSFKSDMCIRYWFNPNLLEVIDTSEMKIEVGDFVLVIDSYKTVKELQDKDHGGWVEPRMLEVCYSLIHTICNFQLTVC